MLMHPWKRVSVESNCIRQRQTIQWFWWFLIIKRLQRWLNCYLASCRRMAGRRSGCCFVRRSAVLHAFNYHAASSRYVLNWAATAVQRCVATAADAGQQWDENWCSERRVCVARSVANWQTRHARARTHVLMTSRISLWRQQYWSTVKHWFVNC